MRKLIACLVVMTGAGALGTVAGAAPLPQAPIAFQAAHVQTVQYHSSDWRSRQAERRHEEARRREALMRARHHHLRDDQRAIRR